MRSVARFFFIFIIEFIFLDTEHAWQLVTKNGKSNWITRHFLCENVPAVENYLVRVSSISTIITAFSCNFSEIN